MCAEFHVSVRGKGGDEVNVRRNLIAVSFYGMLAGCYLNQESCQSGTGDAPSPIIIVPPTPTPTPSPTASPTPDPCSPITGVIVGGPTEAVVGDLLAFDITPVSAAGKLEGKLDFCNTSRIVLVERVSANLILTGSAGFKTTFTAKATGPFEVQFRVEAAVSPVFAGTIKPKS